jgi:hypothetical protein
MWNFKLTSLMLFGMSRSLVADEISLDADSFLSGKIGSISESGILELSSPLAPEPVLIHLDQLTHLDLEATEDCPTAPSTRLELTNGDVIMGSIEALDLQALTFQTPNAGSLRFPRHVLESIQVGIHEAATLYRGPEKQGEWSEEPSAKSWAFADGVLSADGPAAASKSFDLPERFVFKFNLHWEATANFVITFADPLTHSTEPVDRYLFIFNGAGIEIKREASSPARFQSVLTRSRTPDQFANRSLNVEIRVDRKNSRLYLYLDGQPEITGLDPLPHPPTRGGITLMNRAQLGSLQEIKAIELLSFDNNASRHLAEKPAKSTQDSLITQDDDRFSGRLLGFESGAPDRAFSFKTELQDPPLLLSEDDVSTLLFAEAENANPQSPPPRYLIHLWDKSQLSADSFTLHAKSLIFSHPLLGTTTLSRASISSVERLDTQPAE